MYNKGRTGAEVVYCLAHGIIGGDNEETLHKYFPAYFGEIMNARVLNGKDYSDGVSKIILMLEELVYNTPKMHRLAYDYII